MPYLFISRSKIAAMTWNLARTSLKWAVHMTFVRDRTAKHFHLALICTSFALDLTDKHFHFVLHKNSIGKYEKKWVKSLGYRVLILQQIHSAVNQSLLAHNVYYLEHKWRQIIVVNCLINMTLKMTLKNDFEKII